MMLRLQLPGSFFDKKLKAEARSKTAAEIKDETEANAWLEVGPRRRLRCGMNPRLRLRLWLRQKSN